MNEVQFFHLAQTAIVDKLTNSLSIINLIEGFGGVSFPLIPPPFAIVLRTKRDVEIDPDTIELEFIIKQKDNELFKGKFKTYYQGKSLHNLIVTVSGLLVKEPSPIEVVCMYEGKEIAKSVIEVKDIPLKVEKRE